MDSRQKRYAVINMGRKLLGMEEDSYRAMVKRISGHESLKSCSFEHLDKIIDEMVKKGVKIQAKTTKKPKAPSPILGKVKSLWYELHECGAAADNSDLSLSMFCKRYTDLDSWHWMSDTQALKVIEILKQWKKRYE